MKKDSIFFSPWSNFTSFLDRLIVEGILEETGEVLLARAFQANPCELLLQRNDADESEVELIRRMPTSLQWCIRDHRLRSFTFHTQLASENIALLCYTKIRKLWCNRKISLVDRVRVCYAITKVLWLSIAHFLEQYPSNCWKHIDAEFNCRPWTVNYVKCWLVFLHWVFEVLYSLHICRDVIVDPADYYKEMWRHVLFGCVMHHLELREPFDFSRSLFRPLIVHLLQMLGVSISSFDAHSYARVLAIKMQKMTGPILPQVYPHPELDVEQHLLGRHVQRVESGAPVATAPEQVQTDLDSTSFTDAFSS